MLACVGDDLNCGGYPSRLQELIDAAAAEGRMERRKVRAFGVPGATVTDKPRGQPFAATEACEQALRCREGDVVVLLLGRSDARRGVWENHHQFRAQYMKLALRFVDTRAKCVLVVPPGAKNGEHLQTFVFPQLNDLVPEVASRLHVTCVSAYEKVPMTSTRNAFEEDGVNLSEYGTDLVAEAIFRGITDSVAETIIRRIPEGDATEGATSPAPPQEGTPQRKTAGSQSSNELLARIRDIEEQNRQLRAGQEELREAAKSAELENQQLREKAVTSRRAYQEHVEAQQQAQQALERQVLELRRQVAESDKKRHESEMKLQEFFRDRGAVQAWPPQDQANVASVRVRATHCAALSADPCLTMQISSLPQVYMCRRRDHWKFERM